MRHYKVKTIQALERGIAVMAALREMRAASLHDLHLNTGIPKPTLTRILYTLYRQGLVWQRMADGGRNSIAMPVRTGGHVLGCVNLTWRRRALPRTEVVQRYAGDLRTAVTTIENRLADAGVDVVRD